MEQAERRRQWVNGRLQEMQLERGITEHSDLSLVSAIRAIDTLRTYPRRIARANDNLILHAMADWHPVCPLATYKDVQSTEYRRDFDQFGVYVIFEFHQNRYIPVYVESVPRYVGMSIELSKRLGNHATGRSSTPAKHVTEDWLQAYATEAECAAYSAASDRDQRWIRENCMDRRALWVMTAHVDSKSSADQLERAMTRLYERMGFELWNNIKFSTTPPFGVQHKD